MTAVVAIDIGTTSAKAATYDEGGREHGVAEVGYPLAEPEPGQAVQDPGAVVQAAVEAARRTAGAAAAAGLDVAGISCSGAMHALVAVGAGDRPITPVLTWADQRATPQAERLRDAHPELHARTGTPLHPMSPLAKLAWFAEHDPATAAAARRWCGVKELVLHRLTGAWLTEPSTASGTGLLRLDTGRWDAEALALAGIGPEQLCELVPTTHTTPLTTEAAREIGLAPGTPVVAGAGDGPLANVGVGAVQPGIAACSIGTSGALRLVVDRPAVDPHHRAFCYALTPGRWVVGGAINNGGIVLRWAGSALAPDLGPHPEAALLELAAQAPPGSEALIMLPYLLSERAPHWSALPRGAYVGLTRAHGRPHLVRAALEGVCQQLALVLAGLRDAGHEVHEIRATGGFARSALWRQMLCDALDAPLGFPRGRRGSCRGAALLGLVALGALDDLDRAADLVTIGERLRPEPSAARVYAAMLPTFAALYEALAPAFRTLRDLGPGPGAAPAASRP
ncbi:MAG TPA: gluconokinase [Baekduia sp.]|nr:gluconokinase [Baekduia sp.]